MPTMQQGASEMIASSYSSFVQRQRCRCGLVRNLGLALASCLRSRIVERCLSDCNLLFLHSVRAVRFVLIQDGVGLGCWCLARFILLPSLQFGDFVFQAFFLQVKYNSLVLESLNLGLQRMFSLLLFRSALILRLVERSKKRSSEAREP